MLVKLTDKKKDLDNNEMEEVKSGGNSFAPR